MWKTRFVNIKPVSSDFQSQGCCTAGCLQVQTSGVLQAAAVELATLATCERDETAAQQARLERLQCAKGRAQKQAQAATRFARAEEWCASIDCVPKTGVSAGLSHPAHAVLCRRATILTARRVTNAQHNRNDGCHDDMHDDGGYGTCLSLPWSRCRHCWLSAFPQGGGADGSDGGARRRDGGGGQRGRAAAAADHRGGHHRRRCACFVLHVEISAG